VLAVNSLDVAAGRASAPISVLGPDSEPPASWPYELDAPARGSGALAPNADAQTRVAALYAITTFSLGSEHGGLRVLEIRVRYRDGCIVWLNGIEVARRAIEVAGRGVASRPHGPEWETFYVPAAPGLLRLGDNVLAIEARPGSRRDAPELAVDVVGRRDLGIVRGPLVGDVQVSSATIKVETDPNLEAVLEWGVGARLEQIVRSSPGRVHTFSLTGLPPRSKISYRVRAGGAHTPVYMFTTAPAPGDVVRIGVYGDVRGGHDVHRRLVEGMLGEALDLVVVTGDMVLRGSDEGDWQRFFAVTRDLLAQVRYLPAIGNHDVGWTRSDEDVFTLPAGPADRPDDAHWYSLQVADVFLVFLDSNAYDRAEQERWLAAELAAARARKVRAIIVLTHDGPFSRGTHGGNLVARERYVPILARHQVDLVLAGHDHLYQRGEHLGVRYIVSGGGGAGLYRIACGVAGKPACVDDGMQKIAVEHHYIVLTLDREVMEMCPRRPGGRLLEKCVRYRLVRP
jgi:acid phosphatase type 7